MSGEQNNDWLQEALKRSALYEAYLEKQPKDDLSGWGERLCAMCGNRPSGGGLLLTGPVGCGKHTAAAYLVRKLREAGYGCAFLTEDDVTQDGPRRLSALADAFYDRGEPLCLVIEGICPPDVLGSLERLLCQVCLQPEEPAVFLLLICEEEARLPSRLGHRLYRCRFGLPDDESRNSFLKKYAKDLTAYLSLDLVREQTAGMSYGQIRDIVALLRANVDQVPDGILSDGAVSAIVAEQRQPGSTEELRREVLKRARQFFDELPELLQRLPQGTVLARGTQEEPKADAQSPIPDRETYLQNERKRIENQPPKELSMDLFGQETTDQLMRCGAQAYQATIPN